MKPSKNYIKQTSKIQYVKMREAFHKIQLYHQALYKIKMLGNLQM